MKRKMVITLCVALVVTSASAWVCGVFLPGVPDEQVSEDIREQCEKCAETGLPVTYTIFHDVDGIRRIDTVSVEIVVHGRYAEEMNRRTLRYHRGRGAEDWVLVARSDWSRELVLNEEELLGTWTLGLGDIELEIKEIKTDKVKIDYTDGQSWDETKIADTFVELKPFDLYIKRAGLLMDQEIVSGTYLYFDVSGIHSHIYRQPLTQME